MTNSLRSIVGQIHNSSFRMVIAITGGGSGAIATLLSVPGGSRTLLDAVVPYDLRALAHFLGLEPVSACSGDTAIKMASRACDRAAQLAHPRAVLLGIGVTASLVSNRPKHGEHRCHIAAIAGTTCYLTSIVLEKGRRDRAQEEELVAQAIVYCVAEACGIDSPGVVTLIGGADRCIETSYPVHDWFNRLAHGEADRLTITPDGKVIAGAAIPRAVLAGSFDPLHEGHIELAHAAEQILGTPVAFEISIENVDKPPLAVEMVRSRVEQFAWRANVEVTRAATFLEKAKLLAGATFVVGADTAERIILPKYYGNSAANMKNALGTIASSGCSFLVAVREDQSGKVQSLDTVEVPADFAHLFKPIPEGHFRRDLSSTAIRSKTRH